LPFTRSAQSLPLVCRRRRAAAIAGDRRRASNLFTCALAMPRAAQPWYQPAREADQERRERHQPWPLRHVQMVEVAVTRQLFAEILSLIAQLRAPPAPA
jgi:hypothetical protein